MALFQRKETPPRYSSHTDYKPFLRRDFQRRCAYCERSEYFLGGAESFEIDHFRPQSRFPDLRSLYENLYYCCRKCNVYKSSIWPSDGQVMGGSVFCDPCVEDPYQVHLSERLDGTLDELTPCGEFTNGHIRLDRPDLCEWRKQRRRAGTDLPMLRGLEDKLLYMLDSAGSLRDRGEIESNLEKLRRLIHETQERFLI
jgi:uncharacterized protein (TIGR02646 family)